MQCQQCGCEGAESAWLSTIVGLHPGDGYDQPALPRRVPIAEFVNFDGRFSTASNPSSAACPEHPFQTVTAA